MAAPAKKIVLITGANSGVGYALASLLMAKGSYHVLVGSRSTEKGKAAIERLQGQNHPGSAELVQIDVTDDSTVEKAAASVAQSHGRLDLLVNNAGIPGMGSSLRQQMRDAFDVNATGTAMTTVAFADLLKQATGTARILNVSSGAGSIGRRLEPTSASYKIREVQYRASKAAMNMVTACSAVDYAEDGMKVFAFCPGFTQSNLSEWNTEENGAKSGEQAAAPMVDILEGKRDAEAGKFLHDTGVYPW